jgi:hypothetical protein
MVFGVQKVGFCIAKVWFLFFKRVFFVLQYIVPCPRNTPKWRCNTSYRTHEIPPKWRCNTPYRTPEHPQNGVALVLFGNIIFTYFWVLPTFLYLTNFAFAK